MVDAATLDRIPLLGETTPAAREVLLRGAVLRRFTPGALLWRAGGSPRGLFVVVSGRVRILRARDGRQQVVHTEGAGATLGEVPLFDGGPYPATAEAVEATACLVVPPGVLWAALDADRGLARAFLAGLARRVRTLVGRLEDTALAPVRVRVAAWVLARHRAGDDGVLTLGLTQAALAEELGTVREVVARHLTALCREGTLERAGRGRLRVVDARALERAAEGEHARIA